MNTNGYLINDDKLALFEKYPPRRLNISLYGADEKTYSDLCGIPAFEAVKNNILHLREAGINVKINMSVTELNKNDICKVNEFANELGVPFQPAGYMFPAKRLDDCGAEDCRMSAEDYARSEIEHLKRYKSSAELREYAISALEAPEFPDDCGDGERIPCRAGKSAFWVTWDGKLLPCGMMTEPSVDVKKYGFTQAWKMLVKAVDEIRLPTDCSGCRFRCVCSVCAAKCHCETGSFAGKPDYICRFAEKKYELLKEIAENAEEVL